MIDVLNLSQVLAQSSAESVVEMLEGYQEEVLLRGGGAVNRPRAAAGGEDKSRFAWGQPVLEYVS